MVINADPDRLRAYNMSPDEVVAAVSKGSLISPSGNIRIGDMMPMVPVNSVVGDVSRLGDEFQFGSTERGRYSFAISAPSKIRPTFSPATPW